MVVYWATLVTAIATAKPPASVVASNDLSKEADAIWPPPGRPTKSCQPRARKHQQALTCANLSTGDQTLPLNETPTDDVTPRKFEQHITASETCRVIFGEILVFLFGGLACNADRPIRARFLD
jgi:hypothetical protein